MATKSRFGLLRTAWRLLFVGLLLGGWSLAALALHVVLVPAAPESATAGREFKVLVLPKNRLGLADTFADTRGWTPEDAAAHEALVSRLVEAGHAGRLGHLFDNAMQRRLDEMLGVRRSIITTAGAGLD